MRSLQELKEHIFAVEIAEHRERLYRIPAYLRAEADLLEAVEAGDEERVRFTAQHKLEVLRELHRTGVLG